MEQSNSKEGLSGIGRLWECVSGMGSMEGSYPGRTKKNPSAAVLEKKTGLSIC